MNPNSPARILVIEDNRTNRELMVYLLKAFAYAVVEAVDGVSGVETARRERPDLIVCDVHLPKLDGYGVVKNLKGDCDLRDIPIVAVTALAMVGDRDRILAAGFDGYISKPIEPAEFVEAVTAFLPETLRSKAKRMVSKDEPEPSIQLKPSKEKSITVLVVDDTPANLALARDTLEPSGYEVITATGVANAVSAAEEKRPDLVLCDLNIPPGSGLDLLEIAKTNEPLQGVPILIISSTYMGDSERRACLAKGAANFVSRPIEPEALLAEIDKALTKAGIGQT
jgi:two-component system cell cycle response regulator